MPHHHAHDDRRFVHSRSESYNRLQVNGSGVLRSRCVSIGGLLSKGSERVDWR